MTWTAGQRDRRRAKYQNDPTYRDRANARRRERYAARGPSGKCAAEPPPQVGEGLELKGQSVLIDGAGKLSKRWDKSHARRLEKPVFEAVPPGHAVTKTTTAIGPDGRPVLQYVTAKPGEAERWEAFKKAAKDEFEQYRGAALAIDCPAPDETWKDYMSFYWWGDPHIGMLAHASETLGGHYDLRIAEAQLVECFRQLVWRTPPSRVGRIVNVGDFYHAETNMQTTPGHGHKLDVDGRAYKVQKVGLRILRAVVDLAKQRHEIVEFVALPGNHDPNMAFQIAAWLGALYEGDPRVVIDESIAAYNYREFGQNLIGVCHGDGAKENTLPLLLATRQREAWGRTRYHQMHAGHIHHTRKIEHSGCLTWYHNTLADKDAWSAKMGFDSEQFLESSTYHERFGPEGSVQVGIERVRAALEAAA